MYTEIVKMMDLLSDGEKLINAYRLGCGADRFSALVFLPCCSAFQVKLF